MPKCAKSPDGIHVITMDPIEVAEKLHKKDITMEEATKAQFCICCGDAIW